MVVVETRRAGLPADQAVRWTCEGEAEYTIEDIEKADRGTTIILYLKEEAEEFANDLRVRSTIKKYSDHIAVPIEIKKLSTEHDEEGEDQEKGVDEYQALNTATALWTRPRKDINEEEYREFYKHVSHDFEDPLTWSHNRVEGKLDYTSLLYIPSHAPFDLQNREVSRGFEVVYPAYLYHG